MKLQLSRIAIEGGGVIAFVNGVETVASISEDGSTLILRDEPWFQNIPGIRAVCVRWLGKLLHSASIVRRGQRCIVTAYYTYLGAYGITPKYDAYNLLE